MKPQGVIFEKPKPLNWSRRRVQEFASTIAHNKGYTPGNDIHEFVCLLGGTITTLDWENPNQTGSIEIRGPRDFTIHLSPYSGQRRSRFTIAHELGHYFLHSKSGQIPLIVDRDGSGPVEWEANWFAAGFLMPEEVFRAKCAQNLSDAELAEHFDVSTEAVQIRRKTT